LKPTGDKKVAALTWLANGLNLVLTDFIANATKLVGATYHLTDHQWTIPALTKRAEGSLVYDANAVAEGGKKEDSPNAEAVEELHKRIKFFPREHTTKIMHDKFLVNLDGNKPKSVLTGSANFTTEGLTSQANLLHTFDSPGLAQLYLDRFQLL